MTDPVADVAEVAVSGGVSLFSGLSTYVLIAAIFLVIGLGGGWYIRDVFYDASETALLKVRLDKETKLANQYEAAADDYAKLNTTLLNDHNKENAEAHETKDPNCGGKPIPAARLCILRGCKTSKSANQSD